MKITLIYGVPKRKSKPQTQRQICGHCKEYLKGESCGYCIKNDIAMEFKPGGVCVTGNGNEIITCDKKTIKTGGDK